MGVIGTKRFSFQARKWEIDLALAHAEIIANF
jgi:hypothetical protein